MSQDKKDGWDKANVLLGVVSALVAVFGGFISWQTHLLGKRQEAFNQTIERVKRDNEARQLVLEESNAAIQATQSLVNQGQLLTGLLEPLVGKDEERRRLAIEIVLIAVPDGQRIVGRLQQTTKDPGTQKFAGDQLSARRSELIQGIFSPLVDVRGRSASELWNWASTDAETTKELLNYAASNLGNSKGVYNTLTVLLRTPPEVLRENCSGLRPVLASASTLGRASAAWVDEIRSRAVGCF